jgi:thymidylate synthase (FAD)
MQEGLIKRIDVLDRGYVDLINYMGSDLTVVNAARVSFGKHRSVWDSNDEVLMKFLIDNNHTSPFEHVQFQFRVKCPLYIRSQWHRHRTWSYNEISRRYTEIDFDYYVPEHFRTQSVDNKQASVDAPPENEDALRETYIDHMEACLKLYKQMRARGVCREQARGVLPQSFYTLFYATVDLHNLLHFIKLRMHPHAQYEMQQYGKALLELIRPMVPQTVRFFEEGLKIK